MVVVRYVNGLNYSIPGELILLKFRTVGDSCKLALKARREVVEENFSEQREFDYLNLEILFHQRMDQWGEEGRESR